MWRYMVLGIAFLGLVLCLGVPFQGAEAQTESNTQIRFINLLDRALSVQLDAETNIPLTRLDASDFRSIENTEQIITLVDVEEDRQLLTETLAFRDNFWSSVMIVERDGGIFLVNVEQPISDFPLDHARAVFFNDLAQTELSVQNQDQTIVGMTQHQFGIVDIPLNNQGVFSLQTPQETLLDFANLVFTPYTNYLFIATERDDAPTTLIFENNLGATLRLYHFVPDLPPLIFALNERPIVPAFAYESRANFTLEANNPNYQLDIYYLDEDENPVMVYQDENFTLLPDQRYIIALMPSGDDEHNLIVESRPFDIFEENQTLRNGQNAYIIFRHGVPNTSSFDLIYPDGTVLSKDVDYQNSPAILDLPQGDYDFLIVPSGESDVVFYDLTEITLNGGTVYYFAAIGTLEEVVNGNRPLFVDSWCVNPQGCAE